MLRMHARSGTTDAYIAKRMHEGLLGYMSVGPKVDMPCETGHSYNTLHVRSSIYAYHRSNNNDNNNNNNKESLPVVTCVFLLYPFLEHHFHV